MQRARRSALLAALVLAGAATLTGCRSEPGVAIYIGSARHTQHEVDSLAAQLASLPQTGMGDNRTRVVQWLVLRDLIKQAAAREKWPAPALDLNAATEQIQTAVQQGAGPDASADKIAEKMRTMRPVIQLLADFQGYIALAQQHVTPAQPSEADYQELYARAKVGGLVQPGMTEAQFRDGLGAENEQAVASRFALRNLLAGMVRRANVTINPRYAPTQLTVLDDGSNHPLIVLSLDGKTRSAPVRDAAA